MELAKSQPVKRVLIVDDEENIRELLAETLRLVGFSTVTARGGADALQHIRKQDVDLILLDVNMPILDGFETLRKLRGIKNDIPIIMITARADKPDVVAGLRDGADDYITKPFNLEEVVMRVKAVLRRANQVDDSELLTCGPLIMDLQRHEVHLNGLLIDLSKTEFRLLQLLLERQGRVVEKATLLTEIWGYDFETETTVVDTYISYLRRKLHKDGFQGIKTIRGVGFQIKAL